MNQQTELDFREMAKKKPHKDDAHPQHAEIQFEDAMSELESIVRRLEQGGTPLEEALTDYAAAIGLLKTCHTRLEAAERRVEILSGVDANGNPITEAIVETAATLEEKRVGRSNRKSAAGLSTSHTPRTSSSQASTQSSDENTGDENIGDDDAQGLF